MATRIWTGQGINRKQVNRLAPTVILSGSGSFTVTINNNTAVFASTSADTLADVCAGIVAAVQNAEAPEFREVLPTTDDTYVYLTAVTAGMPFTQTSSASGTGAALTTSTTTANKSRNDWSDTLNWAGGVVPVDTDDVIIENTDQSILYGLSQSTVSLASLTIRETFTGRIGNPNIHQNGYYDYRDTTLTLEAATTLKINHNAGDFQQRFRITVGDNNCALEVNGPIDSQPQVYGVVEWDAGTGTHTIKINNGSLAIAPDTQDSVTVSSLSSVDSAIYAGPSATLTTVTLDGQSSGLFAKSPTTLTLNGTSFAQIQDGACTTLDIKRGQIIWQGGNITTLTCGPTSLISFDEDKDAITITNTTMHYNSAISDNNKRVTFTNGIDLYECGIEDVTLRLGKHFTISLSAI